MVRSGSSKTKLGVLVLAMVLFGDKGLVPGKNGTVKAWPMEIRNGRRVIYSRHAHMVFVTKRRGKSSIDVCSDFEVELKEFNGERDHVHLLVIYPTKVCHSELVNSLKGVSSRRLKVEFLAISTFWNVRKEQARDGPQPFRWRGWPRPY